MDKIRTMKLPTKYSNLDWRKGEKAFVRNLYVEKQKGLCYYCNQPLEKEPPTEITDKEINWKLFPPNFLKYPVHLQHNHDTDMIEGAVHAYCNAVMWQYEGR